MRASFFALKNKNLLLLLLGQFISILGSEMQIFALSLYVLKITNSAMKFASVLAVTLIPKIILGPIAGVFIDWFDRKRTIIFLDIFSFILVGFFSALYNFQGSIYIYQIYILCILLSCVSLIYSPAISTVIPSIIEDDNLLHANSMKSTLESFAKLIAPMLAGVILAITNLSIILFINAISFIVAATFEYFLVIPKISEHKVIIKVSTFKTDFIEGISFLRNNKKVYYIMYFAVIFNFVFASFGVGSTFIIKQVLHTNDILFGIFQSSLAIALILGPFISTIVSKKVHVGNLMFLTTLSSSILIEVIALFSSTIYLRLFETMLIPFITILIFSFLRTVISSVGAIALNTAIQKEIPLSVMGRVLTLIGTFSMCSVPLGQLVFGVLFDKIPAWSCLTILFIILFIANFKLKNTLYSFNDSNLAL